MKGDRAKVSAYITSKHLRIKNDLATHVIPQNNNDNITLSGINILDEFKCLTLKGNMSY